MNDIIVGVDTSETAKRAAMAAAEMARAHGSNLHLVTCVERSAAQVGIGNDAVHVDSLGTGDDFLRSLALTLGHDEITTAVSFDDPATMLCAEAARLDARTIVVGNRRVQGATRVLGSVAAKVIRQAPCDVLVANTTASCRRS